ncbi:hypothetical protein R6Q59_003243 [Mikania micrantha]
MIRTNSMATLTFNLFLMHIIVIFNVFLVDADFSKYWRREHRRDPNSNDKPVTPWFGKRTLATVENDLDATVENTPGVAMENAPGAVVENSPGAVVENARDTAMENAPTRVVQKNPNPKYPKIRIRNIRKNRISGSSDIRNFGFGYQF